MQLTPRRLLGQVVHLADRLPLPSGRRQRRSWVGNGRAHVEVRGAEDPDNGEMMGVVVSELSALPGVQWAAANGATGRVVVQAVAGNPDVDALNAVIERVEASYSLGGRPFPYDRPEHPADVEPMHRQALALGADLAGVGLGFVGRAVRASPLPAEVASIVSLADATPWIRRPLESRFGRAATDLGLAVGNAIGQGLTQGPFGLAVDMAQRALLLDEIHARRAVWQLREPELHDHPTRAGVNAALTATRPVEMPDGPVETYARRATLAAAAGAVTVGAVARDPRLAVAATVIATPKAARIGREGFAAALGRELAAAGILPMDGDVLRLLDRVDTVVVDAELLTLDPFAESLLTAARGVGRVAVVGAGGGAQAVRELQAEGACVAAVSADRAVLGCADVGIGVPADAVPWGADLITPAGLGGACLVLRAVPMARLVSRRAATLSAYGAGVGGLLAAVGPRVGATTRALVAVNGAAAASVGYGAWAARAVTRQRVPAPVDNTKWHTLDTDAVLRRLRTTINGIASEGDVRQRLAERPVDVEHERIGFVRASMAELVNPLTPVLASGAGLSAATGAVSDAVLIGAVMGLNAVLGGIQRVVAENALQRLVDDSAVRVRVRRRRSEIEATSDELVVGDVVVLHSGDAVPADCRVLEAHGLEVDESSLTGESQLVKKTATASVAASLGDRHSMLYAGTAVAAGRGIAAVVAVGPWTELGRTSAELPDHRPGGVEERLARLTKLTVPVALGAGAAVVGVGILRGRRAADAVGTGVSLAVAAVPEGLPLVATVAQLAAARRLSKRNTLIRNPGTIEALGRIDVLCFDKTGTLTEGRIRLHEVVVGGGRQRLHQLDADGRNVLATALRASPAYSKGEWLPHATDRGVVDGAGAAQVDVHLGVGHWHRDAELPFESSRGFHAVLGRTSHGHRIAVKGAPEVVLPLCVLDDAARNDLAQQADALARRGYRVLAVAERDASERQDLEESEVRRLRFAGLLGLTDPVRESAARAVRGIRAAGVDVVMLTGDHPSTAEAIAVELDLLNGGEVITGPALDLLSDEELDLIIEHTTVFARVTPGHKVRIVAAFQRRGHAVAVTGDGANDAPAIRLADVGLALGLRGTNAAKEAADVVVLDDRIETIIDAIVEGRAMWVSVRDAIGVLLGGNLGEVLFTVGSGLLLRGGSPLNARQLLMINLLTDLVPSMALAVQPPPNTDPARLLREGPDTSLGAALTRDVVVRGLATAGAGAGAWVGGRVTGVTSRRAGTVALVGVVGAQLGQTLVAGRRSPLVIAGSLGSAAALVAIVQTPGVSQFFGCRPLGPIGWTVGVGAAAAATAAAPVIERLLMSDPLSTDPASPRTGDASSASRGQPGTLRPLIAEPQPAAVLTGI